MKDKIIFGLRIIEVLTGVLLFVSALIGLVFPDWERHDEPMALSEIYLYLIVLIYSTVLMIPSSVAIDSNLYFVKQSILTLAAFYVIVNFASSAFESVREIFQYDSYMEVVTIATLLVVFSIPFIAIVYAPILYYLVRRKDSQGLDLR